MTECFTRAHDARSRATNVATYRSTSSLGPRPLVYFGVHSPGLEARLLNQYLPDGKMRTGIFELSGSTFSTKFHPYSADNLYYRTVDYRMRINSPSQVFLQKEFRVG